MSDATTEPVSVSMTIDAPAPRIFAVLATPADHPGIDGSGMLREGSGERISAVGDVFTMAMHNDEMGDYEMANHVVAYERDRLIAWEPVLKAASRDEDEAQVGVKGGVRWSFELRPLGEDSTLVTETYDCSAAPDWLRRAVKNGDRWLDSMTTTLARLNEVTRR